MKCYIVWTVWGLNIDCQNGSGHNFNYSCHEWTQTLQQVCCIKQTCMVLAMLDTHTHTHKSHGGPMASICLDTFLQ